MKRSKLDKICAERGLRLTPARAHVYDIIAASAKPIGAYDILAKLHAHLENPKPPTVYRALEFLAEHGFVHKIDSLNAYTACCLDHTHEGTQFLICDGCGDVRETDIYPPPPRKQANGFAIGNFTLEVHGHCARCK